MSTTTPPRDPSAYAPSNHFVGHVRDWTDGPDRHLDGDIIRACIEEGEVRPHPHDPEKRYFRATVAAVTYRLVVNVEQGVVVTGYPLGINPDAARDSGRWSSRQIEDILAFLRAR